MKKEPVITPEMRAAVFSDLAKKRWAKPAWKGKKARAEHLRWVASHGAGRPRSEDRCACQAMTKKRAKQRNHKCGKTG